jgi:hypothetical protein
MVSLFNFDHRLNDEIDFADLLIIETYELKTCSTKIGSLARGQH